MLLSVCFRDARDQMRRMENIFNQPFGPMGRGMLEDGGGRNRNRDRGRDRPSGSRELAPFDPGFGFGNMFQNMNQMMGNMMQGTERAFVSAFVPPGLLIYSGLGSLSHDFKIWPITFQGSGRSGPILFSCEKSHFNKNIHLTASLQTPQNRKYM